MSNSLSEIHAEIFGNKISATNSQTLQGKELTDKYITHIQRNTHTQK